MTTLDGFASDMAAEFGESYSDLDIQELIHQWVQESYEEIVSSARWFFLNGVDNIIPIDGVAEYTLDPTVADVRDMMVQTDPPTRVSYMPVERVNARNKNINELGIPRAFWTVGLDTNGALRIRLWPVPSGAVMFPGSNDPVIRVDVLSRAASLSLYEPIPLPIEYLAALRIGVRSRFALNDGDRETYPLLRKELEAALKRLATRFHGPESGGSDLRVKKIRATRQAPSSADGG